MDCRFFLPHFSILCKQISDFRFWKNGCIFHNMQPDCVCKARFFSKNVPISAKKMCRFQAIFAVFHRLSEDFQQRFPQFVERRESPEISEIFLGVGNLSQPVFHENPIFCFNSFNMRIFEKFLPFDFPRVFHKIFNKFFFSTPQSFNFSKWVMRIQLFHTFSTIALLKKKSADSPFFWLFHRFNSPYYYY